ncbi:helix-turn-helix transcriptional regulator [Nocardia arthritidis]|uniref:Helix-turn-helix domain-containing protein n=1 Tax=Nocardia arthritidis TaxID=228602 RepID=A0A6G9Y5F6_9NOCA|nr:helix-turn-helix transcriptional regulator [Nocardia arthritidis]QIS08468.1 helix-turn-helix domain-containing protein [Nocardia arthritidis]
MANRAELAAFLRARRARLRPSDVGLPDIGTRRTPGLRRQEVAQLAGISVDYYIRVEQARGAKPSRQVLAALGRALLLTTDEREYLFRMAGEQPPTMPGPNRTVSQSVRTLLDAMTVPAYVVDATYEILAWNRYAIPFVGDLAKVPGHERNMVRWMFRLPADDPYWQDEEAIAFLRTTIADLRAAYARYPGNPELSALVTELLGTAPRFAALWADHEVAVRRTTRKQVRHPELGPLDFECQVLIVSDTDQRIITYCATPGSHTAAVFESLAAKAGSAE